MKTSSLIEIIDTPQDDFGSIALECHNLSIMLEDQLQQIQPNAPVVDNSFSRGWSIGLESNEPSDDSSKKNIIRRMIDSVIAFIGRLLKKIKDYFFVNEDEQKKNEEFVKNYKGPTDEDLAKAVNKETAKHKSPGTASTTTPNKPEPTTKKRSDNPLKEAIERAERVTGQKITESKAHEFFNGEKMALITAMLSKDRQAVIAAMISDEFASVYKSVLDTCHRTVTGGKFDTTDGVDEFVTNVGNGIKQCNELIQQAKSLSDKELRNEVAKWVMGKDSSAVVRVHSYFVGDKSTWKVPVYAKDYIEDMERYIKNYSNDTSPEAVEEVKNCQKLLPVLVSFITLTATVDSAYSTVLKGLRK